MKYFLAILLLISSSVFAELGPDPICAGANTPSCLSNPEIIGYAINACVRDEQDAWMEVGGTAGCYAPANEHKYTCHTQCACPAGFELKVTTTDGLRTSKCEPVQSSSTGSSVCANGDCPSGSSSSAPLCVTGYNTNTNSCNPISCSSNQIMVEINGNKQCVDQPAASSAASASASSGNNSSSGASSGNGGDNGGGSNGGGGNTPLQNCELAFGTNGQCVPVSPNISCPNYTDNTGQKFCLVAGGTSSVSGGSTGTGSSGSAASQAGDVIQLQKII